MCVRAGVHRGERRLCLQELRPVCVEELPGGLHQAVLQEVPGGLHQAVLQEGRREEGGSQKGRAQEAELVVHHAHFSGYEAANRTATVRERTGVLSAQTAS